MAKKDLSLAEQERRNRLTSDITGGNTGFEIVNRDPGFEYAIAAKDSRNPGNVDNLKRMGYTPVDKNTNSGEQLPGGVINDSSEGLVQGADTVLMRIGKDDFDLRVETKHQVLEEREISSQEEFEQQVDGSRASNGKVSFLISNNPLAKNK